MFRMEADIPPNQRAVDSLPETMNPLRRGNTTINKLTDLGIKFIIKYKI